MTVPNITLNNGVAMPQFGLGVFQTKAGEEVEQAVAAALEAGYRSIDTAAAYQNEDGVGRAIAASGIPRDDIFLTTKLWNEEQGYDSTLRAFEASLKKLAMDYVDLYLIHWPIPPKSAETWRAFERIYAEKRARSIGVSNYHIHHLKDLAKTATITPAVNQVELHPRLIQRELRDYCKAHSIAVEGWSPIMRGGELLEDSTITELAERHRKSPVQVILRWHIQHGLITIPKSKTPERIRTNIEIFDFELAPDEIARIDALDTGQRIGPEPDEMAKKYV